MPTSITLRAPAMPGRDCTPRFSHTAYALVHEGLRRAVDERGREGHVRADSVARGVVAAALDHWGVLARAVLSYHGMPSSADIGLVVEDMVAMGLMGKSDEDRYEDFVGAVDFDHAFDMTRYEWPSTIPSAHEWSLAPLIELPPTLLPPMDAGDDEG